MRRNASELSLYNKSSWQEESKDIVNSFSDIYSYIQKFSLDEKTLREIKLGIDQKGIKIPRFYLEDLIEEVKTEKQKKQLIKFLLPFPEHNISNEVNDLTTFLDSHSLDNNPKKGLTRMYVDRVLFSPVHTCSMHCEWCFRDMASGTLRDDEVDDALTYIEKDCRITDVIITGGEPLLLSNRKISYIIEGLRKIDHVVTIRFHTRILVTVPSRIDEELISILRTNKSKGQPFYFVTQYIHPLEITERSSDAVYRLVNTGIYVYNQAPVLRGVNDDQETFNEWHQKMIKYQIRPYYAITTIIKDGLNSRFYVPFEEVEGLVNNYSSRYDGLGRPTIIIPVMGKKLVPGNLKNAMNQNGAYVRNTKSEIWKGTT
jgi:lysine 2,3-aminomutase